MPLRRYLRDGWDQFSRDLRRDRYLQGILLLAAFLGGFWFWHRIPNFATRDEFSRILDALMPYATFLDDPSLESIREGIVWGRVPFGATTALYGLLLLPVVAAAVLGGQGEVIAALAFPDPEFGFYPAWHTTPAWIWTWAISLVRLSNVAFAVGCVYLTYRLGADLAGRRTGRLGALFLTLTFGFLTIAHEGGEDMPATFFLLLALVLLGRYVRGGEARHFLAASAVGGLAIGFKLTAVPVIGLIAVAHLLRIRRQGEFSLEGLRPGLVVAGATTGLLVVFLSFPTTLVGRLDLVVYRIFGGSLSRISHPTGPDAHVIWWFLRGYLSGLGLGLFVASVLGVLASAKRLLHRPDGNEIGILLMTGLMAYLALFSQWHDFRVHHLLGTMPLIAVLLAWSVDRFLDRSPSIARPALAVLLLSTAAYAGVGVATYADMPRDQAVSWLERNADPNATLEVYRRHFQDTAVPHSMTVIHAYGPEGPEERLPPCPTYVQLGYRDLLYLNEGTYYRNGATRAAYVRSLLNGEAGYEIVAEFGPRPPNFVPQRPTPNSVLELIRLGIVPHTDQYADEQELAANQYTVILKRTESCGPSNPPPPF
ncbi:MAG: ArnT family glycosyltransferase [Halodesulfurarchaeum sp.]